MTKIKKKLTLGQKIKKARTKAGYSQKELGVILKLSDKAISSYEVDRAEPNLKVLKQISQATKTPFQYFTGECDEDALDISTKLQRIEKELNEVKILIKKWDPH